MRWLALLGICSTACSAEAAPPMASTTSATTTTNSARWLTDADAPAAVDVAPAGQAPVKVILSSVPGKRPVVVGLHGSNMVPEWSCGFMWEAFRGAANVVCPAGDKATIRPKSNGTHTFSWSGAAGADRRAKEAIAALGARFPDRVDLRDPILFTYSQSAYLAPALLAKGGYRASLIWEGFGGLDPKQAKTLPNDLRVALVPASTANKRSADDEATAFQRAGARAYVTYPGNVGHGYAPEVKTAMRAVVPKLVAGLPSWS